MVKSDFKKFYEDFTEAKLSLLYSLELHRDSLFSLDDGYHRKERSLDLSNMMYKYFA